MTITFIFRKEFIMKKKRTFLGLLVDVLLTLITGGWWLVWLLIKKLRS